MLRISKDVLETTMRKQTNNTKKPWALLHTTGCKDSPGIVFDAEIVADIITRKSERKDIWQDKMLDITMRKQTETTQKSRILLQALLLVTHIYSTTLSEKKSILWFHSEDGIDNRSTKMKQYVNSPLKYIQS